MVIGIETIPNRRPPLIQPLIQKFSDLGRKDIAEETEEAYQRPYLSNPVLHHSKPSERDGEMHKKMDPFTGRGREMHNNDRKDPFSTAFL
jgi:hypothetical protein